MPASYKQLTLFISIPQNSAPIVVDSTDDLNKPIEEKLNITTTYRKRKNHFGKVACVKNYRENYMKKSLVLFSMRII
jgi:hypothetical protein